MLFASTNHSGLANAPPSEEALVVLLLGAVVFLVVTYDLYRTHFREAFC